MHSVMLLIVSFGALAGLYVLLDAPFTAVTQIIIYAGAIMVLFLFVVMLLNVPREEPAPPASRRCSARPACGSAWCSRCCSASRSCGRCRGSAIDWFAQEPSATSVSSVALIGNVLFTATRSRSKRRRS